MRSQTYVLLLTWSIAIASAVINTPASATVAPYQIPSRDFNSDKREIRNADYGASGSPPIPKASPETITDPKSKAARDTFLRSIDLHSPKASRGDFDRNSESGDTQVSHNIISRQRPHGFETDIRRLTRDDISKHETNSAGRHLADIARGLPPDAPASVTRVDSSHVLKTINGRWWKKRQDHLYDSNTIPHQVGTARAPRDRHAKRGGMQGHDAQENEVSPRLHRVTRATKIYPPFLARGIATNNQIDSPRIKRWTRQEVNTMKAWNRLARGTA